MLAHNLHGIDIDPRAAQIAALALWMRGQRAFNDFQITLDLRTAIARSNIVCAEPMPGEAAFMDEFITEHLSRDSEGRFLASLVRKVFEAMKLACEAGSLLKIEAEIADEVAKAKKRWMERPEFRQQTLFDDGTNSLQKELDLTRGISDESFWEEAEERIYEALNAYSEQAERSGGFQQRLFAADAAQGFAFIDVCRSHYDTVLMNPPFGDPIPHTKSYLSRHFKNGSGELYSAFTLRMMGRLAAGGFIGLLSSRTFLFKAEWKNWRQQLRDTNMTIAALADLGNGVLDGALVEAAATVFAIDASLSTGAFFNVLGESDKARTLAEASSGEDLARIVYHRCLEDFAAIAGEPLVYSIPSSVIRDYSAPNIIARFGSSRSGLCTGDDFRFLRLYWEVAVSAIGRDAFIPFSKGGEYQPLIDQVHLLLDWRGHGHDIKTLAGARVQGLDCFFKKGLTYQKRTFSALGARFLPGWVVTSYLSQFIPCESKEESALCIGYLHSRFFQANVEMLIGAGDATTSGGTARSFTASAVGAVPYIEPNVNTQREVVSNTLRSFTSAISLEATREPSPWFSGLALPNEGRLTEIASHSWRTDWQHKSTILDCALANESCLSSAQAESVTAWQSSLLGPSLSDYSAMQISNVAQYINDGPDELLSLARRRNATLGPHLTRKGFYSDRNAEVLAHIEQVSPSELMKYLMAAGPDELFIQRLARTIASVAFGCCIGRWQAEKAFHGTLDEKYYDPETDIPSSPPVSNTVSTSSLLVVDEGHDDDIVDKVQALICKHFQSGDLLYRELAEAIAPGRTMREWLSKQFWESHIKNYSKSRRKAPIYWQFATSSAPYSIWVYYHRLARDTFFQMLNEYVEPKVNHERQKLERLRSEAGADPTRSQRKEIEDQEKFVAELSAMAEEVERIAPLWNPSLNDGVIINFAPLWRLVPQNKSWQKECKKVLYKLVKGEYDWAHLAMHLWPERVVPKCVADASLAIAHGLEEVFWEQDDRDRFQPKDEPEGGWDPLIKKLVEERTSPAVKAALESLLTAPAPAGNSKSRRRKATT